MTPEGHFTPLESNARPPVGHCSIPLRTLQALFLLTLALALPTQAQAPSQVKELAGLVLVDATLQVNANALARTFELVEVSTPTTPSADHAKVWLQSRGTKQSLKVIFDDGTIVTLGSN